MGTENEQVLRCGNLWDGFDCQVGAYVPEHLFFDGKHRPVCRTMHDDCAVLDALNDFRILASRGFGTSVGVPISTLLACTEKQMERLRRFIQSGESCCLIGMGKSAVFFFSAWYVPTGLILAIRVHAEEDEIRRVMAAAEQRSFVPIFQSDDRLTEPSPLLLQLSEIFYYMRHMLQPGSGLWTHCLTVANFVGCRLEQLQLPIEMPDLSEKEFHRLTAFLCCLFLTLRARTGKIHTTKSTEHLPQFGIRIEQRAWRATSGDGACEPEEIDENAFSFLKIPAFKRFSAVRFGDTLVFDLAFPSPTGSFTLGAYGSVCAARRILLQILPVYSNAESGFNAGGDAYDRT